MVASSFGRDGLLGPSRRFDYSPEEGRYSSYVRDALLRLLKGDRDHLEMMVKYHREPDRLGILAVPQGIDARVLRPSAAEEILSGALRFLHDGSAGGPASLSEGETLGLATQTQDFPTRFPHIVIERTDAYDEKTGDPIKTAWAVRRVQNQRSSIQTNRALDVLNLGVELIKFVL